jgi:hypothetical protein
MARATVRDRIDRDLNASLLAWSHLYAAGLASSLVCKVLFRRWGLCSCGRCGGDR